MFSALNMPLSCSSMIRLRQNAALYKKDVFPSGSFEWSAKTNIQFL